MGLCSITGREGGAQYRCVVNHATMLGAETPASFVPCRDGLLMHVDEMDDTATFATGVQGEFPVAREEGSQAVFYPTDTHPLRVEFDVTLTAARRGKVVVEGELGPLMSVLFFHNGGFGVDLNLPAEDMDACPTGDADRCHLTIEVGRRYRVVVVKDDSLLTMTVDGVSFTQPAPTDSGHFQGVNVSGTARVRDLWVFDQPDAQCARLHRALGRSVTFAASARPVGANVTGSPSMQFCADAEAAFLPTIRASCDEETSIVREAAFASPWEAYCGYTATYLPALSSSGCGGVAAPLPEVVRCQSVLKHFAWSGARATPPRTTGTRSATN